MKVGNFFINLGKALMLPIAVLPIAGILLRIGQPDLLNVAFISAAGNAVFSNLPIIFALGVAIGFAEDNHGSAGLAAFIGHSIFMAALLVLLPGANMGVFSGIIIGALAGGLYNKYKKISLPVYSYCNGLNISFICFYFFYNMASNWFISKRLRWFYYSFWQHRFIYLWGCQ